MNVEGFIKITEEEIKQLKEDMNYARHEISIRMLKKAIENRENSIEYVKKKYLDKPSKEDRPKGVIYNNGKKIVNEFE